MQARNATNSKGIDISHYQNVTSWQQVHNSGISFVIIKSTEGSSCIDQSLQSHLAGAKSVGIKVGVYHFCRAKDTQSAIQEADFFVSTINSIGGFGLLDIAPVLDLETPEGASRANVVSICRTWIERVKQLSGVQPMIYSFPSFSDEFLDNCLADIPLWLADYSNDTPPNHCGWNRWTFIQFSEKGQIEGIDGYVDMDEFDGDIQNYRLQVEDDENMPMKIDDWAWVELIKYVGDAYNDGSITSWAWVQKTKDRQLTLTECTLLKVLIDERRRTKALGIQQ